MAHSGQEIALKPVGFIKSQVRLGKFVHFAVEVRVDLAQTVLHTDKIAQHAVKRVTQVFEFIARLYLAAHIQFTRGDGIADLLEMFDWFHDDITHDHIAATHDQESGQEGGGKQ